MAKKKSKKPSSKQTDIATPLENIKPAPATTTEPDSTSPPEAQQQPAPTPLDPANEEPSLGGSTHLHDHNLEAVQDNPTELEPSTAAESATKSETTQPLEVGHVDLSTAELEEQTAVSMGESHSHVPTEEEPQPSTIEAEEHSRDNGVSNPSEILPEAVEAAVVTASEESNVQLHVNGEPQADVDAELPTEVPSLTAEEGIISNSEVFDADQTGAEEPVTVDSGVVPSHLLAAETTEVDAEVQQSQEHDVLSEPIEPAPTEETAAAAITLEEPSVRSSEPITIPEPPPSAAANEMQLATDDQAQQNEISLPVEAHLSPADAPEPLKEDELQPPPMPEPPTESEIPPVSMPEPSAESKVLPPPMPEHPIEDERQPPSMPEPPRSDEPQAPSIPEPPFLEQMAPVLDTQAAESGPPHLQETAKQRRKREAREREEQEELDQKNFEQYRIDQERLEMARLEQKRLERERNRQERFQRERLEQERLEAERAEQDRLEKERLAEEWLKNEWLKKERLEQERLEKERLERARLEQERLEQARLVMERLEQQRLQEEKLERERIEQEEIEKQRLEKEKVEQERLEAQRIHEEELKKARLETERVENERLANKLLDDAAEAAKKHALQAEVEAAGILAFAPPPERDGEADLKSATGSLTSSDPQDRSDLTAPAARAEPAQLSTSGLETHSQPSAGSNDARTSNPASRLPTPATSVGRSGSPRSATIDSSKARSYTSDMQPHHPPAHRSEHVDQISQGRHTTGSPGLPAPRPQALSQIIQDNRPPAPSPPVARLRARHIPAFDSEDDSDSSAMVRPRRQFRGGEDFSRDELSGSAQYPPQPTHHRSFASRVPPAEPSYSNPPPPQPPGYHPGYYPPTAPPHYQNHNYRVSQQGYPNLNAYGPPSHSSSSPYTEPWNYPPGYRHDSPPHRHDTLITRDYPLGLSPLDTRSAPGGDPGDVFSRIAQAIPDLHVLLAQYKETHGQLSVREELLRRSSVEQDERLRAKDHEIADLRERARTLEHKYSTEASRLRLQIGNLEEQAKELEDQRAATERFRKEALETKTALEAAMKSWEAKYKELEAAHAALARTSAEERADFDEWKESTNTRNDAEKIALAIQFDKRLKEADVLAENRRQEIVALFVQEKDELRSEHQRQQLERQASFDRVRNELETQLGAAQKDREEALIHERESREAWLAEREALMRAHQDDRENIRRGLDEQRDVLEAQYQRGKDELDKAWVELHADASARADEERARVDQLIKEKDDLQKRYNALRAESEQEKSIIKSVANNLESEKSRLEKLMECYGDIAEIKSKGDTYYLVSFSQLQKQIIDLATTHFVHLPVRPPAEDLAQVPSNLPSFLGDTIASRQVRSAYVAHTVSKLITYRVFGPFLFSLGRRYDKADSLFLSMSHHIRDKSTRKEAIWRQQTLLAAFTSSGAKQRINTAAGTVVEEIVNAIKHFADPREEEGIKIAVKRIVKLAAETWRFARLEREMINATMPALSDEEHPFTGPEFWPSYESYKPEGTLIGSLADTSPMSGTQPQLLLRLFPVIWREQKHENFHIDGEKPDEGCIFHHGLALYDDAEPVVQRMEELKSAGLPSYTTTTPTIAENGKFPPPIVPPPREAPPSPPMADEGHDRPTERTAPPSPTELSEQPSVRKAPPPPPPSSILSLEQPTPASSLPVRAYNRPPPGPIDFASPRDLIGIPPPIESMLPPKKTSIAPSAATTPGSVGRRSEPSESTKPPPRKPPPPPPPPRKKPPVVEEPPKPSPTESAIIPVPFPEPSPSEGPSRDPPTPPHSRSSTPTERPVSPLFEAIDETESLQSHRSRQPSKSLSRRRSTHSRRLKDENPDTTEHPDPIRRTSGYALSTKSAKTVDSERTDRTDRTDRSEKTDRSERSERDHKSRYLCESRSAAVKALYPNSPMAGQSTNGSAKGSISSSKKKDRDSKELKRELSKSVPDNATWDMASIWTAGITQVSGPAPKRKDRESKELKKRESIADDATWDSASIWTAGITQASGPASKRKDREPRDRELKEPKRESIADDATWDNASIWTAGITQASGPASKRIDREPREERRESIADDATWDKASIWTAGITQASGPASKRKDRDVREERPESIADDATWDNASIWTAGITQASGPASKKKDRDPRDERRERSKSIPDNGTWDNASIWTDGITQASGPSSRRRDRDGRELKHQRSKSIPDNGTWETGSMVTTDGMDNMF